MTDRLILFGDARAAVLDVLAGGTLAAYVPGVHIAGDAAPEKAPSVAVVSAVVARSLVHVQYVDVHVVAWHTAPDGVHDLAQYARAVVLASDLPTTPVSGPAVTVDPDNGLPMAAFVVRVAMRGDRV